MTQPTHIHQLEVIGSDVDDRTTKRKISRLLQRVTLRPPGMPPEAILCVRHFHDPLPGTFPLHAYRDSALKRWQKAATAELTGLYRRAYAPAHQSVPPSAQAVLFHNQAELLTCMTRDWLTGRILGRWWWQHWLKDRPLAEAVHRLWLEHPVHIPPAFAHLEPNQRISFVQQLPPLIIQRLTRLLVHTFAISPVILAEEMPLAPEPEPELSPDQKVAPSPQTTSFSELSGPTGKASPEAPFSFDWLPELATPSLTLAQRRFLILVTALARRPRLVRQRAFALFVADYLARSSSSAAKSPPDDTPRSTRSTPGPGLDSPEQAGISKIAAPEYDRPVPELASVTDTPQHSETAAILPVTPETEVTRDILSIQQIETAFGGLFYVVNALLYLKIYGDFSTPREPGLELPLWDFLALLGEIWFGATFREDDLWGLLALLADRPPEQRPGLDIPAPDTWRLSPRALRAFPEDGVWSWRLYEGRLYVRHPAGFFLVDVPAGTDDITTQLAAETSQYTTPFTLIADDSLATPTGALVGWQRWFNWLLPFLEKRLQRAFASNDHPADELCRYPARITWTDTHLDIHFKLDDINLSLRQAGLDRNPGWVPAAGRFIAIYFD